MALSNWRKCLKRIKFQRGSWEGLLHLHSINHLPKDKTESCTAVSSSSEKDLGAKVNHKPTGVSNTVLLRKGDHCVESHEQTQGCGVKSCLVLRLRAASSLWVSLFQEGCDQKEGVQSSTKMNTG